MSTTTKSTASTGTFLILVAALVFGIYLVADRSAGWPLFVAGALIFLGSMLRIEAAIRSRNAEG